MSDGDVAGLQPMDEQSVPRGIPWLRPVERLWPDRPRLPYEEIIQRMKREYPGLFRLEDLLK